MYTVMFLFICRLRWVLVWIVILFVYFPPLGEALQCCPLAKGSQIKGYSNRWMMKQADGDHE